MLISQNNEIQGLWFSQKEYIKHSKSKLNLTKRVEFSQGDKYRHWNNCSISGTRISAQTIRVMVRRTNIQYSHHMKKNIKIRFMYHFDISNVAYPNQQSYEQLSDALSNVPSNKEKWVLHLLKENSEGSHKDDCFIWQFATDQDIRDSNVYKIFRRLKEEDASIDNVPKLNNRLEMVPAVYQPSIDSWNNFVRQIHCFEEPKGDFEVTIIFNNEELREHSLVNRLYRLVRKFLYRRLTDVETIRVLLRNDIPEDFIFAGIYSGTHEVDQDTIHGDRDLWIFRRTPSHKIQFYYGDKQHPIIFINTGNHAMAEYDNNARLWKWEYLAWEKEDSPIVFGKKNRVEIENKLKKIDRRLIAKDLASKIRSENLLAQNREEMKRKYSYYVRTEFLVNKTLADQLVDEALYNIIS